MIKKFKIEGYKGVYEITKEYPSKFLAEAKSNTGGTVSLTKNNISKDWLASKGSRNLGKVKWLKD